MISRGDIYYADLSPVIGSEQGGIRPVLVLQNNKEINFQQLVLLLLISVKVTKILFPRSHYSLWFFRKEICYFTWTNKDDWQSSISRKIRYFRWLFYEESQWGY